MAAWWPGHNQMDDRSVGSGISRTIRKSDLCLTVSVQAYFNLSANTSWCPSYRGMSHVISVDNKERDKLSQIIFQFEHMFKWESVQLQTLLGEIVEEARNTKWRLTKFILN